MSSDGLEKRCLPWPLEKRRQSVNEEHYLLGDDLDGYALAGGP